MRFPAHRIHAIPLLHLANPRLFSAIPIPRIATLFRVEADRGVSIPYLLIAFPTQSYSIPQRSISLSFIAGVQHIGALPYPCNANHFHSWSERSCSVPKQRGAGLINSKSVLYLADLFRGYSIPPRIETELFIRNSALVCAIPFHCPSERCNAFSHRLFSNPLHLFPCFSTALRLRSMPIQSGATLRFSIPTLKFVSLSCQPSFQPRLWYT